MLSRKQLIIMIFLVVLCNEASWSNAATHIVRAGDTLTAIARQHNTTVDELVRRNHLRNPNYLYVNQQIQLPEQVQGRPSPYNVQGTYGLSLIGIDNGGDKVGSQADTSPALATNYRVQQGDTLYGIAREMNMNAYELATLNGLSLSSVIYVNDVLQAMGHYNPQETPQSSIPQANQSPRDSRATYSNLSNAATRAANGTRRDCYNTVVRTANNNGARGNGWTWPSNSSYRGQSVRSGLRAAINDGTLRPGMAIYINQNPGTDPSSTNLSNLPHWMTYLGKDQNGVDRFSDQYYTSMTVDQVADNYGASRRIDEFLDPYA